MTLGPAARSVLPGSPASAPLNLRAARHQPSAGHTPKVEGSQPWLGVARYKEGPADDALLWLLEAVGWPGPRWQGDRDTPGETGTLGTASLGSVWLYMRKLCFSEATFSAVPRSWGQST